jgi:hypothetical protein
MKLPRILAALLGSALLLLALGCSNRPAESNSLFNGRDLSGWDGDPRFWHVENGTIIGRTTAQGQIPHNQFLVWQGGALRDFELSATIRQTGNNSGVQYRSRLHPEIGRWVVGGYQCDIHPVQQNNGQLYEERGRKLIGRNGHEVVIDRQGEKWLVEQMPVLPTDVMSWNEYTIVARGNEIEHRINGKTVFRLRDYQAEQRSLEGLLAFQLHAGPAMTVEIRDVRLKSLPPTAPDPFRSELIQPGTGKVPMPPGQ